MLRLALLASLSSLGTLVACSDSGAVVRDGPLNSSGAGNSAGAAGNSGETAGGAGGVGGGGAAAGGAGGSTGGAASGGGGAGVGGSAGSAGSAGTSGSAGAGGSVAIDEPFTPFLCPAGPFGAPVPEGATPVQITSVPPTDGYVTMGSFYNIEGPVWRGNSLLFSQINGAMNVPPSRILKLTGDTVSVFIADAGTSGLALGPNGELYGARHTNGAVVQIDPATINVTAIASLYDSKRFNSPNDLALRSDGNLYFSDPTYQAPFCTELMPCDPEIQGRGSPNTRVYRVEKGTNAVSVIDDQLLEPNGVTLSLDENTLFVTAERGAQGGTLFGYTLDATGAVTASNKLSDSVGGDGMVIDCAGNLYIASPSEVVIMDPTGTTEITRFSVPASGDLTNLAFGGVGNKTLFVTFLGTTGGLYKVDLAIPGRPY